MMYGLAGMASRTVGPEREARGRQTSTPARQRALDARRRARASVPVGPEPIGTQPPPQSGAADAKPSRGLGKLPLRHLDGDDIALATSTVNPRVVVAVRQANHYAD